jgi:TolA-binding protein
MGPRQIGLEELGKELDQALAEATRPDEQIRVARDLVLQDVALGSRGPERSFFARARLGLFAFGAAAAVTAGVWLWSRLPISYEIGGTGVSAGTDAPISAEKGESVPLRFSEGSSIVLRPGGRVRVLGTSAAGAHVLVEDGAVDVAITHSGQSAAWSFEAGPLTVAVTGTRFHLAWNPRDQVFALALSEGAVVVTGSCLPKPSTVSAGGRLELSCATPDAGSAVSAVEGTPAPELSGQAAALEVPRSPAAARAGSPAPSAVTGEKSWRELLQNGDFAEVLKVASAGDFAVACKSGSQSELLGLADAARKTGELDKATLALTTLRHRFPGTSNAAVAAFSLGRIAFERRGAYAEAVRWFSTYLNEAPNGPLMGDAVGRLMEARDRQGDREGARADAEQYLRRFPRGPYAPLAKRLLSEQ